MSDLRAALYAAVESGDMETTASLLMGLDEPTRREIGKGLVAKERGYANQNGQWVEVAPGQFRTMNSALNQEHAAQLALLGTATMSELGRLVRRLAMGVVSHPLAVQVLRDRNPAWLGAWCELLLEVDAGGQTAGSWRRVRALVRDGFIQPPNSHAYAAGMVRTAHGFPGSSRDSNGNWVPNPAPFGRGALGLLRSDPMLLERELWLLFEVEDESSALNEAARFFATETEWPEAILALTTEGAIDRQRLLDATLSALASDWQPHHTTWFVRLWSSLEPTNQERAARRTDLELLLASSAARVVGFAADELHGLAKRGALGAAVIPHLAPALAAPAKRTALRAVAILDLLVKSDPGCAADAALATTAALSSADADVQRRALERIEKWRPGPGATVGQSGVEPGATSDEAIAEALRRAAPGISSTLRTELDALLGTPQTDRAEPTPDRADLERRLAALPAHVRAALALDGALTDGLSPLPAAPIPGEPVLDPALALEPIGSLDELSDALGALTFDIDGNWLGPQLELELITDGVLRWCGDRAPFDGPLKPRVKRIAQWSAERRSRRSPTLIMAAWWSGDVPTISQDDRDDARFDAAIAAVAAGRSRPTVALPTHRSGWIDARVLVQRLAAIEAAGTTINELELAQALLRLAPDGRAQALAAADTLGSEPGVLLRAALGGAAAAGSGHVARAANAVSPEAHAPTATVTASLMERFLVNVTFATTGLADLETLPAVAEFTQALGRKAWAGHYAEPSGAFALAWPAARTLAHVRESADGIGDLLSRGADGVQRLETLRLLLSDREPIEPVAAQHLAWALASATEIRYLLAIDVAVAAIADGRLDVSLLGPAFATSLRANLLIPARVGARLSTVAAVSDLHRAVVRDTVDLALELTTAPRNLAGLLVPFDEWCAATGTRVFHEPTRAFLATLTGSSKSARAATSLLARTGDRPPHEAMLLAQARVSRAERWVELNPTA